MILLDTSVLVEGLGAGGRLRGSLREAIVRGDRMVLSSLVLFEWLRGPRLASELEVQEALFPTEKALPFGPLEAELAAELYRAVPRPIGREIDLAIAATSISWEATLWTLNEKGFMDVPGLEVRGP